MNKLVLIHLSDIHFTRSSGVSVHDLDADLRNELLRDVTKLSSGLGGATGVLVTGDIAYSGQRSEYEIASAWLADLCRAVGCPEENVWVVPGNHDVDRKVAGNKVTKSLQEGIRNKNEARIDAELREVLSDPQSAGALLAPLAEYNGFAARFQCSISPEKPFWERDLVLDCGTRVRMRGLTSTFVSNANDEKGNVVLGTAQAGAPRTDGVLYLTLCHHPPDWLRDQDAVVTQLESRVRIQLFGHKHAQRVQVINGKLRLTAGAMHPEREERDWVPMYNILEIARRGDESIGLRLFQRRWHPTATCFVPDPDPATGKEDWEFIWSEYPRPVGNPKKPADAMRMTKADLAVSAVITATTAEVAGAMPTPNYQRRLTYRFLTLAFRHQMAIAQSLNLLTDEDRALSNDVLFREVFRRAADRGLLGKLWQETERRHSDPADFNPFEDSK